MGFNWDSGRIMDATIVYQGYRGMMEKKKETTI